MSYTIVWHGSAVEGLRRLRSAQPATARVLTAAVSALEFDPRPPAAHQLGASDIYRLHLGELRVSYEIDDKGSSIHVLTVGRAAPIPT